MKALVDDCDYELVKQYSWYLWGKRCRASINGKRQEMGRFLLGLRAGIEIDHQDRNPLNNQRGNIRKSTRAQNQQNRNCFSNNTSGYKGVSQRDPESKFVARIRVNGVLKQLGSWAVAEDAARAYDDAATKYWGNYASLNFLR